MFKEGKRFGFGIFTWPSGCRYEGEWEDDRRHGMILRECSCCNSDYYLGKGKDTWPDSSSFCGEYKQDKFDGYGSFRWYIPLISRFAVSNACMLGRTGDNTKDSGKRTIAMASECTSGRTGGCSEGNSFKTGSWETLNLRNNYLYLLYI